jgi:hypothetical protein
MNVPRIDAPPFVSADAISVSKKSANESAELATSVDHP